MNPLLNEIARSVTGKNDLEACSLQELEQLANKYPAFSTARLLLAAKSRQDSAMNKAKLFIPGGIWSETLFSTQQGNGIFTGGIAAAEMPVAATTSLTAELETPFTDEEPIAQTEASSDTDKENGEDGLLPETTTGIDIKIPSDLPDLASLKAPLADEKEANTLAFEPYHTVDYFASQGIRFKDEQKDRDRFSVQLRSFTDWLKTMKRIPASDIVPATNSSDEKRVEQMAEVSISPREVVTETMAEVWEKQGNRAKAIHIYEKLSLLDPAKSTYFAAKIEQLKHS